jgi:hypothetical protein
MRNAGETDWQAREVFKTQEARGESRRKAKMIYYAANKGNANSHDG